MDAYQQELHIEDELLSGMRADANAVLQKLLQNMVEKDSMEGKLTISLEISLVPEWIPNNDPLIEGNTRRVLTPTFSHKVGSMMQIKKEAKGGKICDGYELVWDEERKEYVLRPIANTQQMTIFDTDFRQVDVEAGSEQAAIEGNAFAALPAPADGDESENDISDEFGANDSGGDDDYPYID